MPPLTRVAVVVVVEGMGGTLLQRSPPAQQGFAEPCPPDGLVPWTPSHFSFFPLSPCSDVPPNQTQLCLLPATSSASELFRCHSPHPHALCVPPGGLGPVPAGSAQTRLDCPVRQRGQRLRSIADSCQPVPGSLSLLTPFFPSQVLYTQKATPRLGFTSSRTEKSSIRSISSRRTTGRKHGKVLL